jgi:hypothetical protein
MYTLLRTRHGYLFFMLSLSTDYSCVYPPSPIAFSSPLIPTVFHHHHLRFSLVPHRTSTSSSSARSYRMQQILHGRGRSCPGLKTLSSSRPWPGIQQPRPAYSACACASSPRPRAEEEAATRSRSRHAGALKQVLPWRGSEV